MAFRDFVKSFADVNFEELGVASNLGKEDFLAYLWTLRDFKARQFSFDRLCNKIRALFRYQGSSRRIIQAWIYHAVTKLAEEGKGVVYGDVLGMAGEISGIFESIFRQSTTLAGIKLGELTQLQMVVRDEGGVEIKEFDAVSTEGRSGEEEFIVTVFEFKFALSLRKLYQQVIGIDSARLPHLVVLTKHRQFKRVRNLVYFGEVGDGHITLAIKRFLAGNKGLRGKVRIARKGYSVKFSLEEIRDFLCDPGTINLAQRSGRRFIPEATGSPEFRLRIAHMRAIVAEKMAQENGGRFDIIVAISNVPSRELAALREMSTSERDTTAITQPSDSCDAIRSTQESPQIRRWPA